MTPRIAPTLFALPRPTRAVAWLVALLALVLSAATPTHAATTIRDTFTVPVDQVLVNACTGEEVALSGHITTTSATIIDSTDGFHAHVTSTPHHLRGTGLRSGRTYVVVGATLDTIQAPAHGAQFVSNFTSTYKLVSQGSSENLQIRMMGHVTITPTGELTAVFSNLSLVCQG
jgi:hypothetical protein